MCFLGSLGPAVVPFKDKVGANGSTPLFVAAKYDRLAAAKLLVQAGGGKVETRCHNHIDPQVFWFTFCWFVSSHQCHLVEVRIPIP